MKLCSIFFDNQNTKISHVSPSSKYRIKPISFLAKRKKFKNVNTDLRGSKKLVSVLDSSHLHSTCFTGAPRDYEDDLLEMAAKALGAKRLFCEPDNTSSILEAARVPFKDCMAMAIESNDPPRDFQISMEEMIHAYGLRNWEHLELLLAAYLRMNGKKNHGFIIEAFISTLASNSWRPCCCPGSISPSSSSNTQGWWEIDHESIIPHAEKGKHPKHA